MKLVERILVATGSDAVSQAVVETAIYAARQFDSKLDFIHVTASDRSGPAPAEGKETGQIQPDAGLSEMSERLDEIAQQAVAEGVKSAETVVVEGDPFERISAFAESQDANVIIAGAGEQTSDGQVFLGKTAARLRRWATKPVWIVKPGNRPPIRKILCPVDMLSASYRALGNAIHFARKLDAELAVLTVAESHFGIDGDAGELRSPVEKDPPERREPHHRVFDDFLSKFDFHQVRSQKVIRLGDPRHEVVNFARENAADLIVMGSAGRTGLAHVLIGGVARRVAQVLPCSIITVRSESTIKLAIEGEVPQVDAAFCATHPLREECDRFQHGNELLQEGLAKEAIEHYQGCIAEYGMCPNAWLQLSKAHARIGDREKARDCAGKALEAERRLELQRIEDEIRGNSNILHRRMFEM